MKNCTLKFNVPNKVCTLKSAGKPAIEIKYNSVLEITLFYSFREQPLMMSAVCNVGDNAKLVITDAHLALYINEILRDEEWPCGVLPLDELKSDELNFTMTDHANIPAAALRKGISAENIRLQGVNIGDCMPFSADEYDGKYHLFWLYDRHHHNSKWHFGAHQWGHCSTSDLVNWDEHPMAVGITAQFEGSICTGSVIKVKDKFYAWYAVRMTDGTPARISYATSNNGDNFEKSEVYFTLPERYIARSARDPKVVYYDGMYHMILTASLAENKFGCLAHFVSENADMSDFKDLGPILVHDGYEEPECPDYFEHDGVYYLVWSISSTAHYAYSTKPFGNCGWTIPKNNTIDCGKVPKSAICPWDGTRVFAGFKLDAECGYAGSLVLKRANFQDDRTITLTNI